MDVPKMVDGSQLESLGFKEALLALMRKYHVELVEYENYDGEEMYCGSEYIFRGARNEETKRWDIWLDVDDIAVDWH